MKTFLIIFLAGYAVRCDDSNYFVVQMPDRAVPKDFRVYWNVPTMQCLSKKVSFMDLYEKYGIIQNTGDTFRGDKISILYDPGEFPALLTNSSSGQIIYRNGGVPQEGSLIKHLESFQKVLIQSIPDSNFSGIGIIDFESWRPVLRQNFGTLLPYKNISYSIERQKHWWWKQQWIEDEAKRRFEVAAREFMQATIWLAKKLRPKAKWGYYGFPYCFNMNSNKQEACAENVPQENDGIPWLWKESTALYPSVYSSGELTQTQLISLIRGRVREAARVARNGVPILPYFWSRYRDNGYFSESDLNAAFSTLYKSNASGFLIWGSSNDVNTLEKCKNLLDYVTNILGPTVAKYTKPQTRLEDNFYDYSVDTELDSVNATQSIEASTANIKDSIVDSKNISVETSNSTDNKNTNIETNNGTDAKESSTVGVTEDPFKKNTSEIIVTETPTENGEESTISSTATIYSTYDDSTNSTTSVSDTTPYTSTEFSTESGVTKEDSTVYSSISEQSTKKELSTYYPSIEDSTTISTYGTEGTTVAPANTEQVVVSVV